MIPNVVQDDDDPYEDMPELIKQLTTGPDKDDEEDEEDKKEFKSPIYRMSPPKTANVKDAYHQVQVREGNERMKPLYIDPNDLIDKIIYDEKGKKGVVKAQNGTQYRVTYTNGKNDMFTYQELIKILNKEDEDGVELWGFDRVLSNGIMEKLHGSHWRLSRKMIQ